MRKIMIAAALASAISAAPVAAQKQSGLVNVNVSDIDVMLREVISKNNIAAEIPVNAIVQVPIGLAANVCGTTVALLSAAGSAAQCDAKADNTTKGEATAIARALQRQ